MPKGGELGSFLDSFLDSVQPDSAVTKTHNHEQQFCDICKGVISVPRKQAHKPQKHYLWHTQQGEAKG